MRDEERELATDAHNEVGMTMRKIRAARWNGSRRVEFNVPATRSVARLRNSRAGARYVGRASQNIIEHLAP
jgi:hypothetical protein